MPVDEYYAEAKRIKDNYFRTGKLTPKEFFDYYWNKSQTALVRSLGETDSKIKQRLNRKWENAFRRPMTVSLQNFYQGLADSHKAQIEATGRYIESRKNALISILEFDIQEVCESIK